MLRNRVLTGLVVRLVPRLFAPAVLIAAVRFLGVRSYGQLSVAIALSTILSQGTELGFNQYIIRRVKEGSKPAELLGDVLAAKVRLIIGVIAAATLCVFVLRYSANQIVLVILALTSVLAGTVGAVPDAVLIATGRFRSNAWANLTLGLGSAVLPLAGLLVRRSAIAFLIGLILANVLYATLAFATLGRRPRRGHEPLWHGIRWYAASSVLEPLYSRLDLVVLGSLGGVVAAGVYAPMYAPLNVIWSAGDIAAFLVIGRFLDGEAEIATAARLACVASGAVACMYYAAAQPAASLLFRDSHVATASHSGRILAIASIFVFPNRFLAIVMRALGAERRIALTVGAAAAIDVTANLVLDSRFGAVGAAVGMLISEVVLFGLILASCPVKLPPAVVLMPMFLAVGLTIGLANRPYISVAVVAGGLLATVAIGRRQLVGRINRSTNESG